DAVVVNADAAALYGRLLPDRRRMRRLARLGPSSSAFLVLAAVEGRTPGLPHHSIVFSGDHRRECGDVFGRRLPPRDPTIHIACSAVDDPSQAPPGAENWVLQVNVPAGDPGRWPIAPDAYRDLVLERLAQRGHDLSGRLRFTETFTPADLRDRYGAWGGAIYGTAYRGVLSPFRRPGNRGPRRGLYRVGGSAHPGGGLPLVAMGGRIVASLVEEDFPARAAAPAGRSATRAWGRRDAGEDRADGAGGSGRRGGGRTAGARPRPAPAARRGGLRAAPGAGVGGGPGPRRGGPHRGLHPSPARGPPRRRGDRRGRRVARRHRAARGGSGRGGRPGSASPGRVGRQAVGAAAGRDGRRGTHRDRAGRRHPAGTGAVRRARGAARRVRPGVGRAAFRVR